MATSIQKIQDNIEANAEGLSKEWKELEAMCNQSEIGKEFLNKSLALNNTPEMQSFVMLMSWPEASDDIKSIISDALAELSKAYPKDNLHAFSVYLYRIMEKDEFAEDKEYLENLAYMLNLVLESPEYKQVIDVSERLFGEDSEHGDLKQSLQKLSKHMQEMVL